MIGWKLLGSLLILCAGGMLAATVRRLERRRLSVLDAWIDLLIYMRGQIDCYLLPLDEILSAADKTLLLACSPAGRTDSLAALLQGALPYLDGEGRLLLVSLVRELGSSYREEQLKRCDYYVHALQICREKVAEALPARLKIGATLSICAAISAVILLW